MENEDVPVRGFWMDDKNPESNTLTTICKYDHLTHFALLLASDRNGLDDPVQDQILDILTKVNCFLSLFGIIVIMLTAFLFERWRKNTGNQILINFSIAISIKILMLYISELVDRKINNKFLCYISGAILHYSVLSEFCWMLIIAILQFKRFVEVLGGPPKYIILKSCICGWLLPGFPVFCILVLDIDNYLQSSLGICYPSGLGLVLGVWLPLIIIITTNFIIFLFIIYNVFHKRTEFKEQINYEILFQWRLVILLFSMLGLTWFFGFISLFRGTTIFTYLFCFTASLQGFIMFLFFIVFNKSTRFLYAQSLKSWMYINGYKYH